MSSITEIYVCKPGQPLKKGKLFTSNDIHGRQDAELDATERCGSDGRIAKVAYYALQDDGQFKSILVCENPNVDLGSLPSNGHEREKLMSSARNTHALGRAVSNPSHSLFSKLMMFFTEELR